MKVCSIDGCGKPSKTRNWCVSHYMRFRRNGGDPLGGRPSPGEALQWLKDTLSTQVDECIDWPFGRNAYGYGSLYFQGETIGAHRAACIMVHGEPASGQIAVHSCGRGMQGCVNHRHVRWGTPKENADDRTAHRRAGITAWEYPTKLSDDDVRQIRSEKGKTRGVDLAKRYSVDQALISRILSGKARATEIQPNGIQPDG
jgi:hypothetical protein